MMMASNKLKQRKLPVATFFHHSYNTRQRKAGNGQGHMSFRMSDGKEQWSACAMASCCAGVVAHQPTDNWSTLGKALLDKKGYCRGTIGMVQYPATLPSLKELTQPEAPTGLVNSYSWTSPSLPNQSPFTIHQQ